MEQAIVCDTPNSIERFRLCALKGMVKLEALGMRHSGGNVKPRLCKAWGISTRTSHAEVIKLLEQKLEELSVCQK